MGHFGVEGKALRRQRNKDKERSNQKTKMGTGMKAGNWGVQRIFKNWISYT